MALYAAWLVFGLPSCLWLPPKRSQPIGLITLHVKSYADELNKLQEKVAVICETKLEARFSRVRTEETNLGNFIADLIRTEFQTDFGHFNGADLLHGHFDSDLVDHGFFYGDHLGMLLTVLELAF